MWGEPAGPHESQEEHAETQLDLREYGKTNEKGKKIDVDCGLCVLIKFYAVRKEFKKLLPLLLA